MLLSILGQSLCRSVMPRAALQSSTDLAGNFLQTFGGMYGVIVAFVIFVVWQQHNETQVAIEREAVSLCELFRLLNLFRQWPAREQAQSCLQEYARAVPMANDPSLRGMGTTLPDQRVHLEQAFNAFLAHVPSEPQEQRMYDAALSLFRQVIETREHRRTVAALRLPDALRWFVFLGGATCVGTLWFTWSDSFLLQAFFVAGMAWVVVAASSIVVDLDDPYTGDFIVDWHRFRVAQERMQALRNDLA